MEKIKLGESVSASLIPEFYAKHGNFYAVSFLSADIIVVKSYNMNQKMIDDGNSKKNILGRIKATPEMAKFLGLPTIHYLLPIVEYRLVGRDILQGYSHPMEKKYIKLTTQSNENLVKALKTVRSPLAKDFQVSVVGDPGQEKFQQLNFLPIEDSKGLFLTDENFVHEVKTEFVPFFESVAESLICKDVPLEYVMQYLNGRSSIDIMKELNEAKINGEFEFSPSLENKSMKQIEQPKAQAQKPQKSFDVTAFLESPEDVAGA